jgi:hypothetical protein
MPKTETHHEPSPDELAHASTDADLHHPGDVSDETHGLLDHGETDGHDDHAHGAEPLGPIDRAAWGALLLGVGAGLLVVVCLVMSLTILAPIAVA